MTDEPTPLPADPGGDNLDIDYSTPAEMPGSQADALDRASWHMAMAARLTTERDQLTAVYRAEMDRLQLRLQHRTRILNERIAWHEEPVRSLHLAIARADPRRKTIELPYGTSKVTVPKTPKLVITDKAALLAWAENNHPDILSRDVNVTGVKTIATMPTVDPGGSAPVPDANGEVIPGVEATLDMPKWNGTYETETDR